MDISRREFIRQALLLGSLGFSASALFSSTACGDKPASKPIPASTFTPTSAPSYTVEPTPTAEAAYLSVARGQSPTAMVQAAVDALGGIGRFVKPGDDVIVKPNMGTAYRTFEQATTTNPEVVAALVALCLSSGARRVRVMDYTCSGLQEDAHTHSGIAAAVLDAGGDMEVMSLMKFQKTSIPQGCDITVWPVYTDVLQADVLINVPIAKKHELAVLTLGMKNLMGLILDRHSFHENLGQRIADLNSLVRPNLTVIDAVRIRTSRHPFSDDLGEVELMNTIIASADIVAADSYAATLFGMTGADVPAIVAGSDMGLGIMNLDSIRIQEIEV